MKYLKQFQTTAAYNAAKPNLILPNVSLIKENNKVEYNPSGVVPPTPTETRVVCKYNVEYAGYELDLCYNTTNFSAMEIDGVEQPSVVERYTFSTTGEHTVKYTLTDPTSIGEYVFDSCNSLSSIEIPNSVTSIGDYTFQGCGNLTSINIPSGVTSIGTYTFYACGSLTSCTIGNGVTSIGFYVFNSCSSLTSITIPNSVISIDTGAFRDCDSLDAASIAAIEAINPNDAFYCD